MRIRVDLGRQCLELFGTDGACIRRYAVSTGERGAGERSGSLCTPRGRHRIRARIGAGAPAGAPIVMLAHQPRSAAPVAATGAALMLSGHTHGGQYFPLNLLVHLFQPYVAGLHLLEETWIYVSRGSGYWGPPNRFGAPSEVTLLRLRRA